MTNLNARVVDAQKALEEFAGKNCWFCAVELHDKNRWEEHAHVCLDCGNSDIGNDLRSQSERRP